MDIAPNDANGSRIGLLELKRRLSEFISGGRVDNDVVEALLTPDGCAAVESELLDYKLKVPSDTFELARLAVQVVSLHNTYGGYLVFGVDEVLRDQIFVPRGVAPAGINQQQLRATIRNYTGKSIELIYLDCLVTYDGKRMSLGLLYVPKRLPDVVPVKFGKPGPKRDDRVSFAADDVFYRVQDSNVRAQSSEDWWFLASERRNPHASADAPPVAVVGARKQIVDENLPDRNVICPRFVGRSETILQLWQWLSDDFQFAKVLAGDGGKGKTSIAYQFAEEICRSRPFDFEKVIWVTGKTAQFRGLKDDYDPIQAHYGSYAELLAVLCEKMPILAEEVAGSSPQLLKQMLRDAFAVTHTFVVIDDVDSLPIEEQRMAFEAASDIGNSRSRFLLTTRSNFTYSSERCLTVRGFDEDDYEEYVHVLLSRLGADPFPRRSIMKLRSATDGSPLYTESLIRLVRNNMPLDEAIKRWKGDLGLKVRRAALDSEVALLSTESCRVLLAAVYLFECSYTELRQVTAYDDDRLNRCIDELKSLFLIGAPRIIAKEPRFSVQSNTRSLVLASEKKLAVDADSIRRKCDKIRAGEKGIAKRAQRDEIAAAITQSNAFMRERTWDDALSTLNRALKKRPDNLDLLFALGKFWIARDPPDFEQAKKAFRQSYEQGQRRYQLYSAWYDCEYVSGHFAGAVAVAASAITDDVTERPEWLVKRAAAHKAQSLQRAPADAEGAIEDLRACNTDLKAAWPLYKQNQAEEIFGGLVTVGSQLWALARKHAQGTPGWIRAFDVAREIIAAPDAYPQVAEKMVLCIEQMVETMAKKGTLTSRERGLVDTCLSETLRYVTGNRKRTPNGAAFIDVETRISTLAGRIDAVSSVDSGNVADHMPHARPSSGEIDVFLAHNSADKSVAKRLADLLILQGLRPWLDEREIPPGQPFQDHIQRALARAKAIAVLIGQHGMGRWQAVELRTAISRAVEEGRPVIPVMLPHAASLGAELSFLMEFNYVVFPQIEDRESLDRLIWGISYSSAARSGSE